MMNVPERVTSVVHPLVSSMYLKKDYGANDNSEDVLVIETNFSHTSDSNEIFEFHLSQLLGDLRKLQIQAEKKIGHFDRVDIRAA